MSISYSKLKKIAYFCLLLPSLVFVLGFLKWYFALAITVLLAIAYIFVIRDTKIEDRECEDRSLYITSKQLFIIIGVVAVWCFLSGLGNLYYQSEDWGARNAIYRDLIRYDWPVVYPEKNAALVYYIGYWLPPALIGKLFYGISADLDVAWMAGNIALWLWSVICIVVIVLMTMMYLKVASKKHFWIALAVFIGFSGMDIIGTVVGGFARRIPIPNHIEWWTIFQYSSMVTCLAWVFNQAIFTWLATICFLSEKKTRNYAFIIVCALASAPIPCVGLAIYMLGAAAVKLYKAFKEKHMKAFWKDVFTVQNIIPTVILVPLYFLYYKTNVAVNIGQAAVNLPRDLYAIIITSVLAVILGIAGLVSLLLKKKWQSYKLFFLAGVSFILFVGSLVNVEIRLNYLSFIMLESVLFLLVLWDDHKNDPIFYISWLITLICPLIKIGTAADFCMRASIPLVFVLMVMSSKYLLNHIDSIKEKKISYAKITCVILIVFLFIGAITPFKEFERGFESVISNGKIDLVMDDVYTFKKFFPGGIGTQDKNFIAADYDKTFFFKFFAK
jgi:hypothetical protein